MLFDALKLSEPVLRAARGEGYSTPTPIQQQAVPHVLAGTDLFGCAQTGTGKTAAFALPILCRLYRAWKPEEQAAAQAASVSPAPHRSHSRHSRRDTGPYRPTRVLVLAPTRELASQIHESFTTYGQHTGLRAGVIFGGVGQRPQTDMLAAGVDILVATPGRLLDLMGQGYVQLGKVEILVLDEADRMLDMGFIHDIRKVIGKLPKERQTLLFSATMPREIMELASTILRNPVKVQVAAESTTADKIAQSVYLVDKPRKPSLLRLLLESDASIERALVFTRTKHGADRVTRQLHAANIKAEAIHGNKSQSQRQRALAGFKKGSTRVLIATDIAARGLDIDGVSHVFNFDLPEEPQNYVHRIGRTARAGASGQAISFCDREEQGLLRDIERSIRLRIPVTPTPEGLAKIERPAREYVGPHGENSYAGSHRTTSHQGRDMGRSRRDQGGRSGSGDKIGSMRRSGGKHSTNVERKDTAHQQAPSHGQHARQDSRTSHPKPASQGSHGHGSSQGHGSSHGGHGAPHSKPKPRTLHGNARGSSRGRR